MYRWKVNQCPICIRGFAQHSAPAAELLCRTESSTPARLPVIMLHAHASTCNATGMHAAAMQPCSHEPCCCAPAAVDAKGNARLQGGDQFKVDICGPASPAPEARVDDNLDGCAVHRIFAQCRLPVASSQGTSLSPLCAVAVTSAVPIG